MDNEQPLEFIAPRNFKRGRFLFNRFRPLDVAIWTVLLVITFIFFIVYMSGEQWHVWAIILIWTPAMVCTFLLIPFGQIYHNMLFAIRCALNYYKSKHNFYWEGIYKYEPETKDEPD